MYCAVRCVCMCVRERAREREREREKPSHTNSLYVWYDLIPNFLQQCTFAYCLNQVWLPWQQLSLHVRLSFTLYIRQVHGKRYTSQTAADLYVASGGAEDWYDLLSKSMLNITVCLDLKIIRCRRRLTYSSASLTSKFVGISISETP